MTTDQFFETVERVFATWRYDHPRILYALMRSLKPKVAVEVGTYRGYAACYMARALQENGVGHLTCIDDFSEGMQQKYDREHWVRNIYECGVEDVVTLKVGKSDSVTWPENVDFAYLDGWHGYNTVKSDFGKAAMAGAECICLDDVTSTVGPSLFVQELRGYQTWDVLELFRDCGLAVCVRRQMKPPCNFSQELPDHPGTVMTGWTVEQKRKHLAEASKATGVNYSWVEL
jgi:hypothetical protein